MAEEKSFTMTAEMAVDAKRLFVAGGKESSVLLPKLLPEVFASVTFEGSNGSVGTVRHIVFGPDAQADTEFGFVKEHVDEIDENNLVVKYTVVEGGLLGKKVATAHGEVKYSPHLGGGCMVSHMAYFTPLPGMTPPLPEKVQQVHGSIAKITKALEDHLLSHP